MRLEDQYLMLRHDVKLCQWSARDFESEQLTNSEEKYLTEFSLIVNYIAGIGYDKGDDY